MVPPTDPPLQSAALQDLYDRLATAGSAFTLDPAQQPALKSLTGILEAPLGVKDGKLALVNATVATKADPESVRMTARGSLLGAQATATFVFSDVGGKVESRLRFPIGAYAVSRLADDKVLPAGTLPVADGSSLERVVLTVSTPDDGMIVFNGRLVRDTSDSAPAFLLRRAKPPAAPPGGPVPAAAYLFAANLGADPAGVTLPPVQDVVGLRDARLVAYHVPAEPQPAVEDDAEEPIPKGLLDLISAATALVADPRLRTPLPSRLPAGLTLAPNRGIVLAAKLDLGSPKLLEGLLGLLPSGTGDLTLVGVIDAANLEKSRFAAALPDVSFGGVAIERPVVRFRGISAPELGLSCQVGATVFGQAFRFHGDLAIKNTSVTGTIAMAPPDPTANVPAPARSFEAFGIPGFVVEDPELELGYTFAVGAKAATSTLTVQGGFPFGPVPGAGTEDKRPRIRATLRLEGGRPVLLEAAIPDEHEPLSLAQLLMQCIGGPNAWPAEWLDVELNPGTRIYYFDGDPASAAGAGVGAATGGGEKSDHEDGLNVDAHMTLQLVKDIPVRLTLRAAKGATDTTGRRSFNGIKGSVGLEEPIKLYCVELAGDKLSTDKRTYAGGPALTIDTNRAPATAAGAPATPRFGLDAGVNLFGKAIAHTAVTIGRATGGATRLDATLALSGAFGPFKDPSLELSYVRLRSGDTLTIENWPVMQLPDNVVDIVKVLGSALSAGGKSGCSKVGDLTATRLHARYEAKPSLALAGDKLRFSLVVTCRFFPTDPGSSPTADPFLTKSLPPITVDVEPTTSIDELGQRLVDGVAASPATFGKALMEDPGDFAAFLAMTFADDALKVALNFACRDLVPRIVPFTDLAAKALLGIVGALTADAAKRAIQNAITRAPATDSAAPGDLELGFNPDGSVTATWSAVAVGDPQHVQYVFVLTDVTTIPSSVVATQTVVDPTVTIAGVGRGRSYTGTVRVLIGDTLGPPSGDVQLFTVGKPRLNRLTYADGQLHVDWTVGAFATGHELQIGPSGQPLASATVGGSEHEGTIGLDAAGLEPGSWPVRVIARRDDPGVPPQRFASDEVAITKYAAPTTVLSYESPKLQASVTGDGDTAVVTFRDPTGDPVGLPISVPFSARTATAELDVPQPAAGIWTATAIAIAVGQLPSAPSAAASLAPAIPPSSVAARRDGNTVTVTWHADPQAAATDTRYQVKLSGDRHATLVGTGVGSSSASIDLDDAAASDALRVQVRALSPGNLSDWSAPVPIALGAPSGLHLRFKPDRQVVIATWDPIAGTSVHYEVELTNSSNAAVTSTVTEPTATIDAPGGMEYHVRVRVHGDHALWSDSVQLFAVGKPVLTAAVYADGRVTASWTAAPFATSYEVQAGPGDSPFAHGYGDVRTGSVDVEPGLLPVGDSPVRIVAWRYDPGAEQQSASDPLMITKLAAPTTTLSYAGPELTALVTGAGEIATVTFRDPSGNAVGPPQSVPFSGGSAQATLNIASPSGTWTATATATAAGQAPSDPSPPARLAPAVDLAKVTGRQDGGTLEVRWVDPDAAPTTRYWVTVAGMDGVLTPAGATSQELPVPHSVTSGTRMAQVAALKAPDNRSAWSDPVGVPVLGAPTGLRLRLDPGKQAVIAGWDPATVDRVSYLVAITRADDENPIRQIVSDPTATIPIPGAAEYHAKVCLLAPGSSGPWSSEVTLIVVGAPALTAATYANGTVTAHFKPGAFASRHELQVGPSDQVLARLTVDGDAQEGSVALNGSALRPGSWPVRIIALRDDPGAPQQHSSSDELTITKYAAPVTTLSFDGTNLTADVTGDGESASVTFHDSRGGQLTAPPSAPFIGRHATVAVVAAPGATWTATAIATADGQIPSDPGAPASLTPAVAPANVTARQDGLVIVAWDADPSAAATRTRYEAELSEEARVATPVAATSASIGFRVGPQIVTRTARVRAITLDGASASAWSAAVSIDVLGAPAGVKLRFDADPQPTLSASWDPIAGTGVHYEVALNGAVATPKLTEPAATIPATTGSEYSAAVRLRVGDQIGPWSSEASIAAVLISAPASLAAHFGPSAHTVDVTWTAPSKAPPGIALTYEIVISAPTNAPDVRPPGTAESSATIDISSLSGASSVKVAVRAVAGDVSGAWATTSL